MCVLSRFSCVQLFVTLWTTAPQAPLSMGFSRQEYCSGLPCPPPRDLPDPRIELTSLTSPALAGRFFITWEAHTVCLKVKVKVAQLCPTLCDPIDYTVPGILHARMLEWVAFPFSRDLPNPGIKPRSPALQADSSSAEPQGKPFVLGILTVNSVVIISGE